MSAGPPLFGTSSPYALDRSRSILDSFMRPLRGAKIFFDGQFKGDYSLAIVNRLLARHLLQQGLDICIHSDEQGWRSDPMLAQFPELLQRCVEVYPKKEEFEFHLRNSWPPKVDDMIGARNVYSCFAWEESNFPPHWVDMFNGKLDLITVTSNFVEHCLRHSGVTVPMAVVGNGCDHIVRSAKTSGHSPIPRSGKFRFLHISSCFPRKGADVLVKAFARAFDKRQPVELVIKTFSNPHNTIEEQVTRLRAAFPDMAPIHIFNGSYSHQELQSLLAQADVLVSPSRGEGFCLPAAEAIMLGVPVIVTAYGGQMDFCDSESSFLVDYRLAPSATHLADPYSTWAEPSEESLIEQMRLVLRNPKLARKRAIHGGKLLTRHFKWSDVAKRTISALAAIRTKESRASLSMVKEPSIDLISTWRQSCGIASYSEHLFDTKALGHLLNSVIAREVIDDRLPAELSATSRATHRAVERLWRNDRKGLENLSDRIARGSADVLWMQHHPGFFSHADMEHLVNSLRSSSYRAAAITLHNTSETLGSGSCGWLDEFDIIFVHTTKDAELLSGRQFNHCAVVPHGFLPAPERKALAKRDNFTIGTFGFLYPHKNLCGVIHGFARASTVLPNLRLKAFTCVRPDWRSQVERARVEILADQLGVRDTIEFCFDYLPEEKIIAELAECDLLCFLYRESSESTTGAVRIALAANRPVLCSKSSVLADLANIAHVLRNDATDAVADALIALASHPELKDSHDLERRQWLDWYGYERAAQRYRGHLEYLLMENSRGRVGKSARSVLKRFSAAA